MKRPYAHKYGYIGDESDPILEIEFLSSNHAGVDPAIETQLRSIKYERTLLRSIKELTRLLLHLYPYQIFSIWSTVKKIRRLLETYKLNFEDIDYQTPNTIAFYKALNKSRKKPDGVFAAR